MSLYVILWDDMLDRAMPIEVFANRLPYSEQMEIGPVSDLDASYFDDDGDTVVHQSELHTGLAPDPIWHNYVAMKQSMWGRFMQSSSTPAERAQLFREAFIDYTGFWSAAVDPNRLHFVHSLLCFLAAVSVPGLDQLIDDEVRHIMQTVDVDAMTNWGYNIYEGHD